MDLASARQIQRSLWPRAPPRIPGLHFAVHYEPAFEVGGDFFDFLALDRQHLGVVVGDVSGKAISAALYMARVTSELRAIAPREREPSALLRRVNAAMADAGDDGMFCTVALLALDPTARTVRFANAGHTVPLLRRAGRVIALEAPDARTTPIGLEPTLRVGVADATLQPEDLLLLYTDGLIEGRAPSGEFYGQSRLERVFQAAPSDARAAVAAVLADLDAFVQDASQADDQTVVCIRVTGEGA
jgi:serine phosphatase RsbU (regulator of sigma subunit)